MAETLRLSALFYDWPFSADVQVFGEIEFREDAEAAGTLAYTVARRGKGSMATPARLAETVRAWIGSAWADRDALALLEALGPPSASATPNVRQAWRDDNGRTT